MSNNELYMNCMFYVVFIRGIPSSSSSFLFFFILSNISLDIVLYDIFFATFHSEL